MEYSLNITSCDAQTDSRVMLGYTVPLNAMDPEAGSCQLGNLMLFKGLFCFLSEILFDMGGLWEERFGGSVRGLENESEGWG